VELETWRMVSMSLSLPFACHEDAIALVCHNNLLMFRPPVLIAPVFFRMWLPCYFSRAEIPYLETLQTCGVPYPVFRPLQLCKDMVQVMAFLVAYSFSSIYRRSWKVRMEINVPWMADPRLQSLQLMKTCPLFKWWCALGNICNLQLNVASVFFLLPATAWPIFCCCPNWESHLLRDEWWWRLTRSMLFSEKKDVMCSNRAHELTETWQ
jgi:hypothetical protein